MIDKMNSSPEMTHFGYKSVLASEKADLVRSVFDGVADRYDIMNDLMSFGIHRFWKNFLIDYLRPRSKMKFLDLGGGTGDIAFRLKEAGGTDITICDINQEMLSVGRNRSINKGWLKDFSWICGNAEMLPFPSNSFDCVIIAFALRNVTHIDHAIAEAFRVLKPGGRFLCLEFSHVTLSVLVKPYDFYSFKILPKIGKIVTNQEESYQYLAESIRQFPQQNQLAEIFKSAGFEKISWHNLSGGIAAIHSGWRL